MINDRLAEFHWLSPLGISVLLFLLQSVLTMVACFIVFAMGVQITTVREREHGGFLLSGRMDSLFFGKSIRQLVDDNPQLIEIDRYTLDMPPVVLILASVIVPVAAIFGWVGLY